MVYFEYHTNFISNIADTSARCISIFRCVGDLCGNKLEVLDAERVFILKSRFFYCLALLIDKRKGK